MAGTDPRRSSRARTTQSNNCSTASSTSGRSERNTRLFKTGSPQKSTSASLSSEPPDDLPDEPHITRRRRRGLELNRDATSKAKSYEMSIDDEIQEDDEVVRCVCGYDDYPGPPPFDHDSKHGRDLDSEPISASEMTEDLAGFYLQCDLCNVWQHGACFGITDDASAPKEYFCELCKPSLHKVFTASNGQRYSSYLPLKRSLRTSSRASSHAKDGTKSPQETITKNTRLSAANQTKRRSTMNSRYDEEEQLRLAIEASKEDALPHIETSFKRSKRGRSDSEEKHDHKRQRTDSRSVSPALETILVATREDSTDTTTRNSNSSKKIRMTTSRITRENSEREEKEKQKSEAVKKRNSRPDRRRLDDSPSDESPLAVKSVTAKPLEILVPTSPELPSAPAPASEPVETPASQPSPDTPPTSTIPIVNNSHKKLTRPSNKKAKGRGHHTRDREDHEGSPARSQSEKGPKATEENTIHNHVKSDHAKAGHYNKNARSHANSKISIAEMNRRANVMMEFITRTQLDMAGEAYTQRHPNRRSGDANQFLLAPNSDEISRTFAANIDTNSNSNSISASNGVNGMKANTNQDFKDLNSMEMMDFLSREIIQWQKEYCNEAKG